MVYHTKTNKFSECKSGGCENHPFYFPPLNSNTLTGPTGAGGTGTSTASALTEQNIAPLLSLPQVTLAPHGGSDLRSPVDWPTHWPSDSGPVPFLI